MNDQILNPKVQDRKNNAYKWLMKFSDECEIIRSDVDDLDKEFDEGNYARVLAVILK